MSKLKVGLKMGVFALLTLNHMKTLKWCKEQCDFLTVFINEDKYVLNKKGCVPIPADERASMLLELPYVDAVIVTDEPDVDAATKRLRDAHGDTIEILVFHSTEVKDRASYKQGYYVPGSKYADKVCWEEWYQYTTTSDIFEVLRHESDKKEIH